LDVFMKLLRRFGLAVWLAFALAVGGQAALLHDLGHALQKMNAPAQDQYPGGDTCDKCALYAPFSGAASVYVAVAAIVAAVVVAALFSFLPALSRTVVSSRSRAPPSAA
jgi:hypothetical protein